MSRMIYGIHKVLEEAADEMIKQSLQGVTKYSEKSDILTPWKQKHRDNKEILTPTGFPEAHNRKGMYHRRANSNRPDLNSVDGIAKNRNRGQGGKQVYLQENGSTDGY